MSPFQRLMKAVEAYDKLVEGPYVAADGERAPLRLHRGRLLVEVLNAARALADVDLTYTHELQGGEVDVGDRAFYSAHLDVPRGKGFDLGEVLGVGWTHLFTLHQTVDFDGSDRATVQFSRPATPEEIEAKRAELAREKAASAEREIKRKMALYEELKAEFDRSFIRGPQPGPKGE